MSLTVPTDTANLVAEAIVDNEALLLSTRRLPAIRKQSNPDRPYDPLGFGLTSHFTYTDSAGILIHLTYTRYKTDFQDAILHDAVQHGMTGPREAGPTAETSVESPAPLYRVLLITGLGTSGSTWEFQLRHLFSPQSGLDGHLDVVCFENRGYGLSSIEQPMQLKHYSVKSMAEDAEALAKHVGWLDQPHVKIHVVGYSMGGMIAQELVVRIPDKVASVTIFGSHAGSIPESLPPWPGLINLLFNTILMKDLDARLRMMMYNIYARPETQKAMAAWHASRMTYYGQQHPRAFLGQALACLTHRLDAKKKQILASLAVPKTVVCGRHDRLVRPSSSRILANWMKAEFVCLERAGHCVIVEEHEFCSQILLQNLRLGHRWIRRFPLDQPTRMADSNPESTASVQTELPREKPYWRTDVLEKLMSARSRKLHGDIGKSAESAVPEHHEGCGVHLASRASAATGTAGTQPMAEKSAIMEFVLVLWICMLAYWLSQMLRG